ncbi:dienelactone hydrolase [Agreia sp. Leaf244]|uniref:dienelactone hydrolase family protein n=1 Tax=Agreia sp. Leaf244 TaxID=1736305 RepID=UPI0006FBB174|nr:dienelactone hydrolase family protein [Agreia sp. Leaf244]KQO09634.1 dienelactone hydrolase [Agreia sp. Leaf244]
MTTIDPTPAFSPQHEALIKSVPLRDGSSIQSERISYEHDGSSLEGYLAWDSSATGPQPGVLVIHDWYGEGEYVHARAHMLARLGYAAFAADIYGAGVRPQGDEAPAVAGTFYADKQLLRARVQAGFDRLRSDSRVDPDRIAVIGYCFGGSATLEFARTGAPIAGAVSFHGGLITHEPADVASLRAPLLVLTGADDPVVPDEAVVAFENELRTAPELDWQIVSYSGAPHAFTQPMLPSYRAKADVRSWKAMEAFFDEILA